jgi:hypothetical protein
MARTLRTPVAKNAGTIWFLNGALLKGAKATTEKRKGENEGFNDQ